MKNELPVLLLLICASAMITMYWNVNITFVFFLFVGNLKNEGKVLDWLIEQSKIICSDFIYYGHL